jgi:hypothetical protein
MPFAGVLKELEMFVAELEQFTAKLHSVSCCAWAVDGVIAVVFAARVVQNSEQADDRFDSSASRGDEQSIAFHTTPVRWAVN